MKCNVLNVTYLKKGAKHVYTNVPKALERYSRDLSMA